MKKHELLKKVFTRHNISIAYLFGSQKEAGFKYLNGEQFQVEKDSDLDIGVDFTEKPVDVYNCYGNIYKDLSEVFEPFNIDIVFMYEVSYIFKFEIISGYRIFANNDDSADDYEEIITKFASDLSFKRKMFEPDFYEALKDGYFEIELKQDQ